MKLIKKTLLPLFLLIMLAACSGNTEKYPLVGMQQAIETPAVGGKIVFTRDNSLMYLALDARVRLNGQQVAKLSRGETATIAVAEGKLNIDVDNAWNPGSFGVSMNVEKGKIYYFDISPRSDSFLPGAAFGLLGGLADSKINSQSGVFQLNLTKVK